MMLKEEQEKKDFQNLLNRIYAEGKGSMKVEILKLVHELRMLPKEEVTMTFIEGKIREL